MNEIVPHRQWRIIVDDSHVNLFSRCERPGRSKSRRRWSDENHGRCLSVVRRTSALSGQGSARQERAAIYEDEGQVMLNVIRGMKKNLVQGHQAGLGGMAWRFPGGGGRFLGEIV